MIPTTLTQTRTADTPSSAVVFRALQVVGGALGRDFAFKYAGHFHFDLGDGWSISVCPESAGRLRIDACRFLLPVATLWTPAEDIDRLSSLVIELDAEISRVAT